MSVTHNWLGAEKLRSTRRDSLSGAGVRGREQVVHLPTELGRVLLGGGAPGYWDQ